MQAEVILKEPPQSPWVPPSGGGRGACTPLIKTLSGPSTAARWSGAVARTG